jgi:hypothetical protein
MSLRDRVRSLKPRRVRVAVPGHDLEVTLQAPTAGAWLEYQRWLMALPSDSLEHLTAIVALTAVDPEDGKPILTAEDCQQLPHDVLTTLARAAMELTHSTADQGVAAAKGESSPSRS